MTHASDPRRRFGDRGEDLAAAFFITRGFRIVGRNWSCRAGEIDLIAERDGRLHFVEVKTRRTSTYGYPEEAITRKKLQHFARAIELYVRAMPSPPDTYQADALAISMTEHGAPEYHYVEHVL